MRLIDADSAINEISRFDGYLDDDTILRLQIALKRLPTIDAVPVVHGHWIDTGSGQECSICGEIQYGCDSGRFYCQNCGAKMDENENARNYEEGYADGKRDAVVHGHWVVIDNKDNKEGYMKMQCSVCGETLWSNECEEWYCCKCGAKMDEPMQHNDSNALDALGEKVTE